jgi:hypothetical protein
MHICKTTAHRWTMKGRTMVLTIDRRKAARIVRDDTYASIWRIDLGDGHLSDMLNLSRAKDRAPDVGERQIASCGPRRPVLTGEVVGRPKGTQASKVVLNNPPHKRERGGLHLRHGLFNAPRRPLEWCPSDTPADLRAMVCDPEQDYWRVSPLSICWAGGFLQGAALIK